MTKYFIKVTSIPDETNPMKNIFAPKIEYYGTRTQYLSSLCEPDDSDLELYGFGSLEAAELAKKRKDDFYQKDYERFHTWLHTIEVLERKI